ncbi:MAG: hypothetical protein KDK39_10330 [Leptospiraceae bacterium]|nr:hypothetical protein [Leptospiraceae bacterium]
MMTNLFHLYHSMQEWSPVLFCLIGAICLLSLSSLLVSIAWPHKRIWPPPRRRTWQFYFSMLYWVVILIGNPLLVLLDWDNWVIPNSIRFWLGLPLSVIGASLLIWSIRTLNWTNTAGGTTGFVNHGAYQICRNPQYLADMLLFTGIGLLANSEMALVTHLLAGLVLWMAVPAEESWLKERYGAEYEQYAANTARFL